jgi:ACS family hexuronate transporter-like MFS transporter
MMESQPKKIGNYRWRIVALLFFATSINYIDRNVLSFAMVNDNFRKDMMGIEGPLTEADTARFKELMGYIDALSKLAYALGFILVGWLIDKIGTKRGFTLSILVWSLAGVAHSFIGSVRGLAFARFALLFGEAGNFPSAVKSVAEWFPHKKRSFATGVFNAGSNVGIICTALMVPYITLQYGWRTSFFVTGALGFILLAFWWLTYNRPEEHPKVGQEELAYIRDGEVVDAVAPKKLSWGKLLGYRQTWAFAMAKFTADPIWWFYLTWLPDFFNSSEALDQKLDLKNIGLPFLVIYLVSDVGSIFFGWLATYLMKQGWSVNKARKTTMLLCALCVVPIFFASITHSIYVAIALISLAAAAHQGWSANCFTLVSDMFPRHTVASVTGIGGVFGSVGGIILAASAGVIRVKFGYLPLFLIASSAYLVGLLLVQLLAPRLEPLSKPDAETIYP